MRKYISSMFSWLIISTLQLHEMMMITDNLTIFPKLGLVAGMYILSGRAMLVLGLHPWE